MKATHTAALAVIILIGLSLIAYAGITHFSSLYSEDDVQAVDDVIVGDDLTVSGAATVGETLGVTGNTTLSSTLAVTGNTTLSGTATINDLTTIDTATDIGSEALKIKQDDADQPFVISEGTSAADDSANISTANGDGSVEGPKNYATQPGWAFKAMIYVKVNDSGYWLPTYGYDTN